ncbi:unnamed protein product [Acanthoscelides obtectus]|uniref:HMG box domain-containing protein n=2 Tax=Acanthoscelides obtectus TaxID=200917 RepID=A0A9P0KQ09_ACAOB|nr:unnamed protein product [Acanthoscelides obtectus]CAK1661934.1 High mobility group protein 20A [Acanthoscelides obtectus]
MHRPLSRFKPKSEQNLDEDTADEANNLLKNGILVETNSGLVCMSVNDALSLNLNLSIDDLRNVAARLISQQNTQKVLPSCDSDGFSSECSDYSTTTSAQSLQSAHVTLSSISASSAVQSDDCDAHNITRPKCIKTAASAIEDVLAEKTEVKVNESPKKSGAECEMDPSSKEELPKKVSPIMMKCMAEVVKPKKGRGGWPKGRKRKPELLNLPPKAPATGYTLYLNEERKLFKNSSLAFHEITKIIGNRWSSLTLDEKKPYLDKAEEDKKRYREELKQYRQSAAYRAYLLKKRRNRLQNNVLSESDMDATDDFDEEDNEELYCRTCDQWFHNLHNKREHLQGKQHIQAVAGVATTSTTSLSTSLDESSLDGMPNLKKTEADKEKPSTVNDVMEQLSALVTKRETELRILENRRQEAVSQQQALCSQLYLLNERHKKLQKDLLLLKEKEKEVEKCVYNLWQVPSWFVITDPNATDSTTDVKSESTE